MEHADLVRHLASVLERMRLPYLITGSTATIFYGEPRTTNDVDVVVVLPLSRITEFCDSFPKEEFYVSEEAVRQAILARSQFNIIHPASGLKVDVMLPDRSPFNLSRLGRARRLRPGDYDASFASPEDVIIKKMEYYKEGASDKHLRDIAGVLKLCPDPIDRAYIERWAAELNLTDIWQAVLRRLES